MELNNNNNNGIDNLTSQMAKLTTHPTEMQVMRFHGRMGSQLTASEKQLINKHLDIIQIVQDGEICVSTNNAEHPELIAEGVRYYGPSLWEKSQLGDKQRAEMARILQERFPSSSNNIMLWTGDRNWEFRNKTNPGGAELMTLQNVGNAHASNATQHMKENFTLLDLAEKVSTGQLPNENAMNINSYHGPPQRKKLIIMACKGDSGGGSGSKKTGGRRKYTRKRKQKKKRRKSRRIGKRKKTRKRRRRRKRK